MRRCKTGLIAVAILAAQIHGQQYDVEIISPSGGVPAPSTNPPLIEARVSGAILQERSFEVAVDGIVAELEPAADALDNDGDDLVDESGERAVSWPSPDITRFRVRWPWALDLDDPGTIDMDEGLHTLLLSVLLPDGSERTEAVLFKIFASGGVDSVVVFPSPFDPGQESTQIAYRVLSPGRVKVEILDFQGQLLRTIESWNHRDAGWHRDPRRIWSGRDSNGAIVANGVYFIKVSYRNETSSKEVVEKCFLAH